jgi:hypothetical protein
LSTTSLIKETDRVLDQPTSSDNYFFSVEGLLVLLPLPQPTKDTTLRARTTAKRMRFIVYSLKM